MIRNIQEIHIRLSQQLVIIVALNRPDLLEIIIWAWGGAGATGQWVVLLEKGLCDYRDRGVIGGWVM